MTTYTTIPGYTVNHQGLVSPAQIETIDGVPVWRDGRPMGPDGTVVTLKGWPHGPCNSYEDGRVLIPVANPRNAGRKPKGDQPTVNITYRLQPSTAEAVKAKATETGLSINTTAEALLRGALGLD